MPGEGRHTGRKHVMAEAEVGEMQPQTKKLQARTGDHNWKPGRIPPRVSGDCGPTVTLISNFQSPELGENKFLLFKPLSHWCFGTAAVMVDAQANTHTFLLYQAQSIQRHTVWYMNVPILLYLPFPILLVTANDNLSC